MRIYSRNMWNRIFNESRNYNKLNKLKIQSIVSPLASWLFYLFIYLEIEIAESSSLGEIELRVADILLLQSLHGVNCLWKCVQIFSIITETRVNVIKTKKKKT